MTIRVQARTEDSLVPTDLAWAAGFWDGEGCMYRDKRTDVPTLQITQAGDEGEQLCERFLHSLGVGGTIYARSQASLPDYYKPQFVGITWGEQAALAFDRARPYLSDTKIGQAEDAISIWRERQRSYVHPFAARTHCKSGHEYTPENIRMRGDTRICLTCRRERALASYYANLERNRELGRKNQQALRDRRKSAARTEVKQDEATRNDGTIET